jgi:hypothetical protein
LEWILAREGNEFLVEIDRSFIKNKFNLIGLKEKFREELNMKDSQFNDESFNMMVKHLYKSSAPTPESLQDEKYVQFVQDIVDLYGMIHNRYIRTPEGKFVCSLTQFRFGEDVPQVLRRHFWNLSKSSLRPLEVCSSWPK